VSPYVLYLKIAGILLVLGGVFFAGFHLNGLRWAEKYQKLQLQDAQATALVVQRAEAANAALTAQYQVKLKELNDVFAKNTLDYASRADALSASLRFYQNHSCAGPVPGGPAGPGAVNGAPGSTGSDGEFAEAARRVEEAERAYNAAVARDAARFEALQAERAAITSK
jgi:hypothetical protein